MRLSIYINDSLLDIDSQTIFSFNLRSNDVNNLSVRNISYTSQISLPITDNNRVIFGYSDNINSSSSFPYQSNSVKVDLNGVTVINNGVFILEDAKGRFRVRILDSSADFFKTIEGRFLRELDYDSYDGLQDLDAICNTTSGIVAPLMDYGNTVRSGVSGSFNIDPTTYLPSFYVSTIIDKIFSGAGYAKSGAVFSEDRYLKMIIPYCRDAYQYPQAFSDYYTSKAVRTTASTPHLVAAGIDVANIVDTQTIQQNESGFYSNSAGYKALTTAPIGTNAVFEANVNVAANITITGGSANIKVLNVTTGVAQSLGILALTGTANYTGTYALNVVEEHQYIIISEIAAGTPTITINSCTITFEVLTTVKEWKFYNYLLPDLEQSDLIKEIAIQFGLIFSESNGTVICSKLEDIILDRSGADVWTDKRVGRTDELDFSPLNYAKNNYFNYSNADSLSSEITQGNLTINSVNATEQKTIYTSLFNASDSIEFNDTNNGVYTYILKVPIYETSTSKTTFDNEPGLRIGIVRDNGSTEVCTFDTSQTNFKVAYFHDPNRTQSMRPQSYLNINYASLSAALQTAKIVTRRYNLTDADIANFDFAKIVFDKDVYLLKQSLNNYKSGAISSVVFLKL